MPRLRPFGCLRFLLAVLVLIAACGDRETPRANNSASTRTSPKSVRMTMSALHQLGGVPPGWQLSPLTGDVAVGRRSFEALGCPSCHKVAGEKFSATEPSGAGPELTGMGGHHPPGYFFEAIINPNAVVVEGPGWVSAQGLSNMPVYDLTVAQVEDLVAYLASLTAGDPHAGHVMPGMATADTTSTAERPAPPANAAQAFFTQTFDVMPGKLVAFENWFRSEGAKRFLAVDGLIAIDTFVDTTRAGPIMTSIWSFRDDGAMLAFANTNDAATIAVGTEFDTFVGPHDHRLSHTPPIYRVPDLSVP